MSVLTRRSFSLRSVALAGAVTLAALLPAQAADTAVKFTLDWKFEGPSAGFFLALDKGYFKEEGLDVTIDSGAGSRESIPRVATGTYDLGFGDINALAKFLDEDVAAKVKAVMVVYDQPPFAVIGRKSQGITSDPKSLEGKTLGAPPPDAAFGQWAAFKDAAKIDDSAIKIESVGFPVREPMLAQGKVDAIFGFAFSSVLNLKANGVPADDIVPIMMSENGLDLYGNAIMVNTDFAEANPEAVKGFIKALTKGFKAAIADPAEGVAAVLKRNQILDADIEVERLGMANSMNINTVHVQENGMGDIDADRMKASLGQLATSMGLKGNITAERLFDAQYLPAKEDRMLK
ncbi:ABC transporter substrate-binding protein [Ahrensia sp. R2A130]|uniref:ABC transporter substrate-binding protein n=1 Tax=Ahrensia sp. R2A130 TaxID=744979 RepID=UPI0001E0E909|nr:ABC transporter substrate-binding protein [Ahrensia sp. R2A130]EFL87472.1 ABC transporter, substrate binding protein [Ahrensia sp. R2A130]